MSVIYYSVTNHPNNGLTSSHFICSLSCGSALWAWELCSTEGFVCCFHLLAGYSRSCSQQVTGLEAGWSKGDSWNSLPLLHMVSLSKRLAWPLPMAPEDSEQAATQAKLEKAKPILKPLLVLHLLMSHQSKHWTLPIANLRVNMGGGEHRRIDTGRCDSLEAITIIIYH